MMGKNLCVFACSPPLMKGLYEPLTFQLIEVSCSQKNGLGASSVSPTFIHHPLKFVPKVPSRPLL